MQSLDFTTIVFALLAIFVVWKLRSVLGTRTGAERPPAEGQGKSLNKTDQSGTGNASSDDNKVVRLPSAANDQNASGSRSGSEGSERWKGYAEPGSPIWVGLDSVYGRDPAFNIKQFLSGSQTAYEMIVTAFAAGDRKILKPLLSTEVYENFEAVISQRERQLHKVQTTFVSISNSKVLDVQMRGDSAQITVKFLSKLISVTRDQRDQVIDGSPDKVVDMVDVWTFARDIGSRDPNWKLIATDAGQ